MSGSGPVLLIDSRSDSRTIYSDLLRAEGFDVRSVAGCPPALDAVMEGPPRAIVAEFDPSTRDECLQFCQRVKADPATHAVPILLISEQMDDADVRRAVERNVLAVAVTPAAPAKLVSALRGVLAVEDPRMIKAGLPAKADVPRSA